MRSPTLSACLTFGLLMLAACTEADRNDEARQEASEAAAPQGADTMASRDPAPDEQVQDGLPDSEARPVMQAQVVLDRQGFSSGVIDGEPSAAFANALEAFQEARGLPVTGALDEATSHVLAEWSNIPATRIVTIPEDWAGITYAALPEDVAEQAKLADLGYASMAEKLAERFHTTPEVLAMLNPGGQPAGAAAATPAPTPARASTVLSFAPDQQIRAPNIGADFIERGRIENAKWLETLRSLGVGTRQPDVARLVVDESERWLRAYDAEDRLVAAFTVTTGSEHDPLPIGDWKVKAVARNPTFVFNPELFWDVDDGEEKQHLPPGPNSPVGVVWIDLDKEHYGIHGTPEPALIGQSESHGCVRLANWDAARLAQMASGRTKVEFRS